MLAVPDARPDTAGCLKCGHDILPGQAHLVGPVHVACPTEREVAIAHRWGRWA